MTTEAATEKAIQDRGLNAPRLTPASIDAVIVGETFTVMPSGKCLICELTLVNGFTVRGEASAVSKENFNVEIGKDISRKKARDQIWLVEGYLLQQRLHDRVPNAARVCHEVNRAYCASIGDSSQPAWADAPDWQRESAVAAVKFTLANPDAPPSAQHDNWMAAKLADGWVYGPVKDAEAKQHPCLVPYDELPAEQRTKDYLFQAVVHSLV